MARNFSHKDLTAGLALAGIGQKSGTVPFHWAVIDVAETDGNVVATLNYHSERYQDATFNSRNLTGNNVYAFDIAKDLEDFKYMPVFEKPNYLGSLRDLCNEINKRLERMLMETAGVYKDPMDIDSVAFNCFAGTSNFEFKCLLRVLVKNEALIKVLNEKYVGNDVYRY